MILLFRVESRKAFECADSSSYWMSITGRLGLAKLKQRRDAVLHVQRRGHSAIYAHLKVTRRTPADV